MFLLIFFDFHFKSSFRPTRTAFVSLLKSEPKTTDVYLVLDLGEVVREWSHNLIIVTVLFPNIIFQHCGMREH